jgi:hypothetical protein
MKMIESVKGKKKKKPICRTEAKPQWIVAQRPLSHLQSFVLDLSRIQRIGLSHGLNLCGAAVESMILPSSLLNSQALILAYEKLYELMKTARKSNRSPISSMDSGLEAFSRNPTHGSFSAWTFPSTEWTNYVNQRFLSYWIGLLSR